MLHRALALILTALTVAAAAVVAFPAGASASVAPTLAVNEGTGAVGGSSGSLSFAIDFHESTGDAAQNVTLVLPDGTLLNEQISGGGCLGVPAPLPQCEIGSGTAVVAGGVSTPLAMYLVQAPKGSDLAGIDLVLGSGSSSLTLAGDLAFHSTSALGIGVSLDAGEEIVLNGLPSAPVVNSLNFTLTGLTLPSVCTPTTADLYVTSDSVTTAVHASAPFITILCNELSYSPTISAATVSRNPGSAAGSLSLVIADPLNNSPTEDVKITLPANLAPNPALVPCVNGVTCTIGTITATSPIFPSSQLSGTINLSGTARSLLLTMDFPPPLNLQLTGDLTSSLSGPQIKLSPLPDMPLTSLAINLVGNSLGGLFEIECYPTVLYASVSPWDGTASVQINHAVTLNGCTGTPTSPDRVGRPKASATLTGVSGDTPQLSIKAAKGKGAAPIRSLSISLPSGLGFSSAALISHGRLSTRVLSISGASVKSTRLHRNTLVLTFKRAVARSSVALRSPLLTESAAMHGKLTRAHVPTGRLTIRITDASGRVTTLTPALTVQ